MRCAPQFAGLALAGGLAAGCSSGFHRDVQATQTYMLRAAAPPRDAAAAPGLATLRIGRTLAAPGLSSEHIVIVRPDHRMDYYAASRWAAPLPEVVEALAVETLRGSGAWTAVNDSQGAFPADYYLQIAIRRFEADYTSGTDPEVRVVLDCNVGRRADRELLGSFSAEGTSRAEQNKLSAVIAAFEQAADAALGSLAQRTLEAVKSDVGRANAAGSDPVDSH